MNDGCRCGFTFLLVLAVCAVLGPATAQEKIELGMSLETGDSITMEMLIEQDIDQDMMGTPIEMDQVIGMTMRFDVLDRPAESGGDWVSCTYTRTRFKQNGPMGGIDFDSDAAPADIPMPARGFAGLVDQMITMEFGPDGRVVQIEGVQDVVQNMVDAMGLPEGPQQDAARDMIKTQLNDDSLKQMMAMSAAMYPDGPVGVGDTWDDLQSVGGMMPMTIESNFELVSWDDDTATLDTTGTITPNADAEPFDIGEVQVEAEMNGTQAGQIVMDRRTGWAKSSKVTQDMEGGMTMLMANGGAMEIDMKIKGTVTMTMVE